MFQTARPNRISNALNDIFIGDAVAAILEEAGGGQRVQCILKLKPAGQIGLRFRKRVAGVAVQNGRAGASRFEGLILHAKGFAGFDKRTTEFVRPRDQHLVHLRKLRRATRRALAV